MRASGYDRVASDFYREPRWVVDALLDAETFTGLSWDPSCGAGNIPEAFTARGLDCIGTDLVPRGYSADPTDFFLQTKPVDNIVSNPPFDVAELYVRHALALARRKVAIFARLAFLESQARRTFFETTPLARVLVSSRRVSCPPGGSDVPAKGGSVAYGWFIWRLDHVGKPELGWT